MTTLARTHKDGNLQIFQNEEKTINVKHNSIRRGGCLYIGEIVIVNRETGKEKSFDSTMDPYCPESDLISNNDESYLRYIEAMVKKHTL